MKHFIVWHTVSLAWSEIGMDPAELPVVARKLRDAYPTWRQVDEVIRRDVLGSFALESSLYPLVVVPIIGLFFITPVPDWGYEEAYLKKRMTRWYSAPIWRHYLNPLRLIGYPIAYLFSFGLLRKLQAAYHEAPVELIRERKSMRDPSAVESQVLKDDPPVAPQPWTILLHPDGDDIPSPARSDFERVTTFLFQNPESETMKDYLAEHGAAHLRYGFDDGPMYLVDVTCGGVATFESWVDQDFNTHLAPPLSMRVTEARAVQIWDLLASGHLDRLRAEFTANALEPR